jgi:hypothetical protein
MVYLSDWYLKTVQMEWIFKLVVGIAGDFPICVAMFVSRYGNA